jgi:hypothetical protein
MHRASALIDPPPAGLPHEALVVITLATHAPLALQI